MNPPRRRLLGLAASAAVLPLAAGVRAQAYPSRPISMIVPASAGGPTDAIARVLAERMGALLGQTIVIDNVAGAGGSIGVGKLARATPDGYTLGIGQWSHYVLNGATYTLPYDLLQDFATISLLTNGPLLLVARKTLPANDLAALVAWLKANPDKASAGTGGIGSAGAHFRHLLPEDDRHALRLHPLSRHRARAARPDGRADRPDDRPGLQRRAADPGRHDQGLRRPVADAAAVDTRRADGRRGGPARSAYLGVARPVGAARDPTRGHRKVLAAVVAALADPATREKLAGLGQDIPPADQQTPQALAAFQKAEIEKWWPIVKAAGIKGE